MLAQMHRRGQAVVFALAFAVAARAQGAYPVCSDDCLANCFLVTVPASGCPGSADPNGPVTDEYLSCVCRSVNLPAYLFCLRQHCDAKTSDSLTLSFNEVCASIGAPGVGPQPCVQAGGNSTFSSVSEPMARPLHASGVNVTVKF